MLLFSAQIGLIDRLERLASNKTCCRYFCLFTHAEVIFAILLDVFKFEVSQCRYLPRIFQIAENLFLIFQIHKSMFDAEDPNTNAAILDHFSFAFKVGWLDNGCDRLFR